MLTCAILVKFVLQGTQGGMLLWKLASPSCPVKFQCWLFWGNRWAKEVPVRFWGYQSEHLSLSLISLCLSLYFLRTRVFSGVTGTGAPLFLLAFVIGVEIVTDLIALSIVVGQTGGTLFPITAAAVYLYLYKHRRCSVIGRLI